MKLSILADPGFGWFFVFGQIIVIYLAFLYIHRKVEKKRKKGAVLPKVTPRKH